MPNMGSGNIGVGAFNIPLPGSSTDGAAAAAGGLLPPVTPVRKRKGAGKGNGTTTTTTTTSVTPTSAMKARRVMTKAGNQIIECKMWESKLQVAGVQCA
jgi:hypothetical protein